MRRDIPLHPHFIIDLISNFAENYIMDEEKNKYTISGLEEYIRQGEPRMQERAGAWQVGIGLQQVDGLQASDYLLNTAKRHIEGEITIQEAKQLIDTYYIVKKKWFAN